MTPPSAAATSTVVVVSYRPGDWLGPCLASVTAQADQVVLVDNGSSGEAASEVGRSHGVEVVRSQRNLGFAGGFALGASRAIGDVVAVLNDDAVAEDGWLGAAADRLEDPTIGAVTPKVLLAGWWGEVVADDDTSRVPGDTRPLGRQLFSVRVDDIEVLDRTVGGGLHRLETNPNGRWRWTTGRQPFYVPLGESGGGSVTLNHEPVPVGAVCRLVNHAGAALLAHGGAAEIGLGAPDDGRFDTATDCFGFSGTAPVWRSETLRRVGGLAQPFFAYNEDTDWCLRAQLAGLRVVYEPGSVVHHRLSATSGGVSDPLVALLAERNALLAMVRNAPAPLARAEVRTRLAQRPKDAVRRSLQRHLPWAMATRLALRRRRTTTPEAVWDRWADVGLDWDASPAGPRSLRPDTWTAS